MPAAPGGMAQIAASMDATIRSLVESAPGYIFALDPDLRIVFLNRVPPGQTMKAADFIGRDIFDFIPPSEASRVRETYRRAFETAHSVDYEINGVGPDGQHHWLKAVASPVSQDGEPVALMVNAVEITDQKRAEERARRGEELLAEAQGLAKVGSWEVDLASGTSTWSDEMYRVMGLEPGTPVSVTSFLECLHPDDRPRATELGEQMLLDGKGFEMEARLLTTEGERIVRGRASLGLAPDGTPQRVVGTAQDVTAWRRAESERQAAYQRNLEIEHLRGLNSLKTKLLENVIEESTKRKKAEDELRQANDQLMDLLRFKTELLNVLSHELGNPLTPIKLQLHLVRQALGKRLDENLSRSFAIMDRNVERIISLSQDMLDVARLETGRLRVTKAPLELGPVVREAVESFDAAAKRVGVQLAARVRPDLLLNADPRRLSQVLFNLLSNALKFTPAGGRIRVEADLVGNEAIVRCVDSGIGFTPAQGKRLFKPFSRVHETEMPTGSGTGLGLYISKGIVEQHGGRIWATSNGPGSGAEFCFALPLKPTALEEPE